MMSEAAMYEDSTAQTSEISPQGLLKFYQAKSGYLQGQIGNPEGEDLKWSVVWVRVSGWPSPATSPWVSQPLR